MNAVVVKVGGSLLDLPDLGPRLRRYLARLPYERILIVSGGGDSADVVRQLSRIHELSEPVAHEIALESTRVSGVLLRYLLGIETEPTTRWWQARGRYHLLPAEMILGPYEAEFAPISRTWSFTTDSLAGCAAKVARCPLILLKSTGPQHPEGYDILDDYFPTLGLNAFWLVNFRDAEPAIDEPNAPAS